MFRSECDLKMRVQNLEDPLPLKIGAQTFYFQRFRRHRNLAANSTVNIFPNKTRIRQSENGVVNSRKGPVE